MPWVPQPLYDKAKRYWLEVLNVIGNVASVVGLIVALYAGASPGIFGYYVVAVATFLAITLVAREVHYARRIAYPEILAYIHDAVHYIRDTLETAAPLAEKEFARNHVQRVVDDLAVAFSVITRTHCRASIKVLTANPGAPELSTLPTRDRARHLLVRTFIRDSTTAAPREQERADFLSDNSDLCGLFMNPGDRWFMENDLPRLHARGGYHNSHLPDQPFEQWPLPYRSAAIWPIRRLGGQSELHSDQELLGFLCVDSESKNVFVPRYDFEVGAHMADALYIYMKANRDAQRPREGVPDGS